MITLSIDLHDRILEHLTFAKRCAENAGMVEMSKEFQKLIDEIDYTKEAEIKENDKS